MLASGDSIRAQDKYAKAFSYKNYAKLIFSANQIPLISNKSYADYKRWIILKFDRQIPEERKNRNLIYELAQRKQNFRVY